MSNYNVLMYPESVHDQDIMILGGIYFWGDFFFDYFFLDYILFVINANKNII